MNARLGSWLVAAVVAIAAGLAVLLSPGSPPPIIRGSAAPAFDLKIVGKTGSLSNTDLAGRVVLINFWATWCKPCEDEMPAMERLYQQLGSEEFELVAISVDDTIEPVQEFQEALGLTFPILLDPNQDVAERFQAFRFPETLLIDRKGMVVERYIGPKEWDATAYLRRIKRVMDGE
ncbi:TlpA family protein disulfide reductase [Myxococcota bacterium]|nr:TlpA family protein disulfide reductase [Myxococcota bacterium]